MSHRKLPDRSSFLFRTRAVKRILLEDIAGLPSDEARRDDREDTSDRGAPRDRLAAARRRAILVVALDWGALLILLFARARGGEIFSLGPSEETIFAIGILAIAAHSGFRLGQLEKFEAVRRILEELELRSGAGGKDAGKRE